MHASSPERFIVTGPRFMKGATMVTTLDFFVSPDKKRRNNRPWDRAGWSKKRKKNYWVTAKMKTLCSHSRRAAEKQLVMAIVDDTDEIPPSKEPFGPHTKWGTEGHSSYWL